MNAQTPEAAAARTGTGTALTFYWHDYETFGVDPSRDAPAQFAGIRTDEELQEIGEPLMIHCQPPRDALPHPQACLITGITPQACEALGLREAEFARRIHAELSAPSTVGVGYNSLKFDDAVSRHLFWRNLLDVYGRESQNGCARWDLFNVVRAVYAFRPDALTWPRTPEGRHSLKLERLSAANGLVHEAAHDALSDVRATIALARLIRQRVRPLWDHCLKLRSKRLVQDIIGAATGPQRQPLLHVSGMYPQERGHLACVWPLGVHPINRNEVIVWDLAHDPMELLAMDAATIRLRLFTPEDERPSGLSRLPIKTIRINESPVVAKCARLSPVRAAELGMDLQAHQARAAAALLEHAAFDRLPWVEVYRPYPASDHLDAEQRLYGGFLDNPDKRRLDHMPALDPQALAQWHPAFDDPRLDELVLRYRARNWPDSLGMQERQQWLAHCRARLHEGKSGHLTLQRFQELIDEAAEQAAERDDERAQEVLEALVDWAEAIAP